MNYYNENDPKNVAWLRELMKENLIAPGVVDERSITEVSADDLGGFVQCHFFAGIGGWSFALRLAGWPDDRSVWTGSCPCQPFSCAGKQLGTKDPRHLWPEFRRLIAISKPPIIFGEQVASADGRLWLDGVRADLEALAYEVGAADLCAAGISAPHIRQRLFWVANARPQHALRGLQRPGKGTGETIERSPNQFGGPSNAGRLAQPSSTKWGIGGTLSGCDTQPQCADVAEPGGACWMGEPIQPRLEGQSGDGHNGNQPGRLNQEPDRPTAETSANGDGLADPKHHGPYQPGNDSPKQDSNGQNGRLHLGSFAGWSSFDIIPCRDGKTRRIESGTFPLAHGIPHRVGLLRGYGNAIVPQLAAEFIQATQEAINQITP